MTFKFEGARNYRRDRHKESDRVGKLIRTPRGLYVRETGLVSWTETPVMRFDGFKEESLDDGAEARFEDGYWCVRKNHMRGRLLEDGSRKKQTLFLEDQDFGDQT